MNIDKNGDVVDPDTLVLNFQQSPSGAYKLVWYILESLMLMFIEESSILLPIYELVLSKLIEISIDQIPKYLAALWSLTFSR